jgi:serine/threonine-protein kinase
MATVYLAHDLRHDRSVALKVLRPELAHAMGADRFLREIRLCARLQHPHILGVHDSGEANGQLWFTMPFVDGETLRSRLAREKRLPVGDALRITAEVADALTYAHGHGVIHRDIKPENILLGGNHALVADFGIARALAGGEAGKRVGGKEEADERLTETGMSLGTPHYMSPEQSVGERDLDARTDVYSLGCVLYEMLAGEPPFTGPNPQSVLAKRLKEPVPHVSSTREVPPAVDHAVTRALARAPADRFASAAEFADALRAPAVHSGSSTAPVISHQLSGKRRWIAALIGVVLLVVVGGYIALSRGRSGTPGRPASAAVLPFTDLSPGKDQEYFSDGLTEELITSLSRVEGIRVAARTSSFQFKGQPADVRKVGRRLEVGAVLEGSVRKSGNRLRVTAQLSSAEDGYQLWSDSYDRELADVFAVQEEIARAIVSALRVRLGARPDSVLAAQPTRDLEAYDLYLKGRFAWTWIGNEQRRVTFLGESINPPRNLRAALRYQVCGSDRPYRRTSSSVRPSGYFHSSQPFARRANTVAAAALGEEKTWSLVKLRTLPCRTSTPASNKRARKLTTHEPADGTSCKLAVEPAKTVRPSSEYSPCASASLPRHVNVSLGVGRLISSNSG